MRLLSHTVVSKACLHGDFLRGGGRPWEWNARGVESRRMH